MADRVLCYISIKPGESLQLAHRTFDPHGTDLAQ